MKINFLPKRNIINTHLKMNWKLILFFGIFFTIISLLTIFAGISTSRGQLLIASNQVFEEGENWSSYSPGKSLSSVVNGYIFSILGIVLGSIFAIVFININISNEVKSGKITFWMTQPQTRTSLFNSKLLFFWITFLIIFSPTILVVLIIGAAAHDANDLYANLFMSIIYFIIFMMMLIALFTLIATAIINNTALTLAINCGIVFYIIVTYIINLFYEIDKDTYKFLEFGKYISIQSLNAQWLHFGQNYVKEITIDDISNWVTTIRIKGNEPSPVWWLACSPFINIGILFGTWIGSINIFRNTDLKL